MPAGFGIQEEWERLVQEHITNGGSAEILAAHFFGALVGKGVIEQSNCRNGKFFELGKNFHRQCERERRFKETRKAGWSLSLIKIGTKKWVEKMNHDARVLLELAEEEFPRALGAGA